MTASASDRPPRRRFRAPWLPALLLPALLPLSGCGTLGYYAQALDGHADLLRRRVPVAELLQDPASSAALRQRLELAQQLRVFASRELALPDNASYTGYSDLERPQALWNVFAAPEFSVVPQTWCVPVAGCVAYRGWYHEDNARGHAAELAADGLDVQVVPVPAYSTLGWSDDPLTNVMLGMDEARLAALLFHELAHQRVYAPGDSAFNESYAVAVEEAGVARWLAARPEVLRAWQASQARQQTRREWLRAARRDLEALYAQPLPPEALRAAKRKRLCALQAQLDDAPLADAAPASAATPASPAADCSPRHNNASLTAVGVYHELTPAFRALLARHGGDFAAFHTAVTALAALPPAERRAALATGSASVMPSTSNSADWICVPLKQGLASQPSRPGDAPLAAYIHPPSLAMNKSSPASSTPLIPNADRASQERRLASKASPPSKVPASSSTSAQLSAKPTALKP
jgi:predicted aminopeptidase